MKDMYLGIDTSNYTTSLALLDESGALIANLKAPLPVKGGEVGLRQSDAVFAHIKNFPGLFSEIKPYLLDGVLRAVGVSLRPRNVDGSYMPVFTVGDMLAKGISTFCDAALYEFSHQCGHIMSAIYSSGALKLLCGDKFASFHISGGTTELVRTNFVKGKGFDCELVGGTMDLNAGQIIDRVGVFMGLGFPCGVEIEKLALKNTKQIPKKKISASGTSVNLSGLENMAKKLYSDTKDAALTSAFVLDYISRALIAMSDAYIEKYGDTDFVFAGGVMSNTIIRQALEARFKSHFAKPELSRDNAVGIAYLTYLTYNNK